MSLKSISLFSGAMGLDLGLEQAGIFASLCNEINKDAVNTIKYNRPNVAVVEKSLVDLTIEEIKSYIDIESVDVVVGGPPCQSFSVFGNRKGIQDLRGQLIFEYFRVVDEVKPKAFIMENVRGLLSIPFVSDKDYDPHTMPKELKEKGSLINFLLDKFNSIGYRVDCFVVNSVNYGAPQIRERVILIGNRLGIEAHFPEPCFSNRKTDYLPPFKTLGEIIGPAFNDPCPEIMNFSSRKLKYLSMIPPGGNWRSLPLEMQKESMGKSWYLKGGRSAYWRKLSFDFPSPTVVTMPNHAGTSMCHPLELRAITVGEAAAIQEFPSDWKFQGTTTSKFKQIGNAVPIRLGKIAGEVVKDILLRSAYEQSGPIVSQIKHIRPHVRARTFFKDGESYSGSTCYYEPLACQQSLFSV
jgi:DNA (cytosine-5)-methyltransferase 1